MKIKILTHAKGFVEREIPNDFMFLRVTLMTGDEIIEIYRRDDMWFDPYLYDTIDIERDNRIENFLDATYIVFPEQIDVWNKRNKSYNIFERKFFKDTFQGYFGAYDLKGV